MEENKPKKPFNFTIFIIGVMVISTLIKILFIGLFSVSTSKLITNEVKQVKNSMELPYQVDGVTTIADITAEPNAIRYHYILLSNSNNLTNEDLKNYLLSNVCQNNKDEKSLLNRGINMEYSYVIKEPPQTLFASLNKEDCLNYRIPEMPTLKFDDIQPIKLEK